MSWAAQRRFFILLIVGAVVVAFLTVVGVATFYETPSCTDNIQNQNETGVDCGGSCAYLCTVEVRSPTVLFTQALRSDSGRIDVIAMVENKNAVAAAKNVPYRITLYGADQSLIRRVNGTLDLPSGARVPVFVPGVASGNYAIANAFLDIDPLSLKWFSLPTDPRVVPTVSNIRHVVRDGATSTPRIEAVLTNPGVAPLSNVQVVILVHDLNGDVIAASATVVSSIPSQGQAVATFTWNGPFQSDPALIEVIPVIPLP